MWRAIIGDIAGSIYEFKQLKRIKPVERKSIKKGDFIEFQKEPYLEDKIIVMVEDLLYYNSLYELLNNINVKLLAPHFMSKEKLNFDLEKFYSKENQNKYGVVAIKLRKNIVINYSNINSISYSDKIFDALKNNYDSFDCWFNKMKANNINIYYTEKEK